MTRTSFVVQLIDAWGATSPNDLRVEWAAIKRETSGREMLRIATQRRGKKRNKNGAHGRARRK